MKKKISLFIAIVLVINLSLAGCKKNPQDVVEAEVLLDEAQSKIDYTSIEGVNIPPKSHISFVGMDSKKPYWQAVEVGAQKAVDDLNESLQYEGEDKIKLVFESPSSGMEVEEQINMIDGILSENPTLLCMAAIDFNSFQAQFETAKENKIPVIAVDSGVSNGLEAAFCATDNFEAGKEAARQISQMLEGKGNIAILSHNPETQTSKDRIEGFTEEIKEHHPGLGIVEIAYENKDELLDVTASKVLEEHPEVDAYFGTNEDTILSILQACKDEKRDDIVTVGFDAGEKQVRAIKDGSLSGAVSQNPYGMGYVSIVAGARAIANMPNDKRVDTGFTWISKENIESEEIEKYLY
ncbi:MAG TPA: ABC transporter substrate-binding protein [Candidatus Merdenecus merdavium]|nr:ABC transporter substrate-binding protein [Candidatus Merdenecus merdavium]